MYTFKYKNNQNITLSGKMVTMLFELSDSNRQIFRTKQNSSVLKGLKDRDLVDGDSTVRINRNGQILITEMISRYHSILVDLEIYDEPEQHEINNDDTMLTKILKMISLK